VEALNGGFAGMRIVYNNARGSHGIGPPDGAKEYSSNLYGINLMTRFLYTGGMDLPDDPCLASNDCSFISNAEQEDEQP